MQGLKLTGAQGEGNAGARVVKSRVWSVQGVRDKV